MQALRQRVLECVASVAPEAELDALRGAGAGADLREELDLDSMDFLHLLLAIKAATGVEVPERDYARVRSLDALVAYLHEQLEASA